jgi:hypothetical protein
MATKNEIISDIELRLTRGKVSDDFELDKTQIGYWVDSMRDSVVTDYLNHSLANNDEVDLYYVESEKCNTHLVEDTACDDPSSTCWKRRYFDLNYDPLKLSDDRGIVLVTNQVGRKIYRAQHKDLQVLRGMDLSRPNATTLVWFREGQRMFVDGLPDKSGSDVSVTVYYAKALQGTNPTATTEYLLSTNLIDEVTEEVERIARREMRMDNFEDLVNDGTQE